MPVERLRWQDNQLQRLRVGYDVAEEQFREDYLPLSDAERGESWVARLVQLLADHRLSDGYCFEYNTYLHGWLAALSDVLSRGAVLLVDYGYPRPEYFLPEREQGTLMCYYRHHAHTDPYFLPGGQDITAHVDFTAVAEAADAAGFVINGYTSQSAFLQANGLLELADEKRLPLQAGSDSVAGSASSESDKPANSEAIDAVALQTFRLSQEVQALCLPGSMGERFQVMGLTKGLNGVMRGFTGVELSHRL